MLTVDRRLESALPPSAPAKRARSARWRDPRLLAGVVLVAVAMAGGALLLNRGSVGTPTVRALRDLPVGVTVSDADVEIVTADIPGTQAYLAQIEPGEVVVRAIHAGELVPADALTAHAPVDVRMVTVPVEPLHAPPGLAPGSRVDVWVTSDREGALPELALADALVSSVSTETDSATGQRGVVLQVAPADAGKVVAASQSSVDLVVRPAVEAQP